MRTVANVVEEILERSPFLAETLSEGVANKAAIARRIKPAVEERLLEEVSEISIAMALHRLEKRLPKSQSGASYVKKMNDLTVRSNLVAFAFPTSTDLHRMLEAVSESARRKKNAFLNFSRGIHESLLIVSPELEEDASEALRTKDARRIDGLSAITMRMPEESLSAPGVYYPILKAIAMEGISLVEVMSVRTEFSIIFENKDVDRAFSILKRIIG